MRLTITLWKALSSLPRGWHSFLGKIFGKLLLILFAKRKRIAKANIRVCFPLMSSKEQKKLLKQNFNCLGCSIFETGIAWFWSDQKIHKYFNYEIRGLDQINEANSANGNLLLFKHSQHLELDARLLALNASIFGVSRSHNSESMDALQTKGRLSSIKETADKNKPRKFIKWLKEGKNVMYSIDQDYGWENSAQLKFFNQEAATITTTSKIIDMTKCRLLFVNSFYENQKLILEIELIDFKELNSIDLAQKINDLMEAKILQHPTEYLWAHRRFKSTLGKNFYK
jgi:lauroyl/myristoyl acyltransferase